MSKEDTGKKFNNEELFSKAVRAGKRTYFFDVKSTRAGENYLTITESKKRFDQQSGKFFYEKHKLFLYQEDFDKFENALKQAYEFIATGEVPQSYLDEMAEEEKRKKEREFTNVEFEDLKKSEDKDDNDSSDESNEK
ncbi:MAG: DUF3276 family protein [Bacteroidetes bacterium]|nr:MAG: DUF3276 family protein [Bacteroidota bacterium]